MQNCSAETLGSRALYLLEYEDLREILLYEKPSLGKPDIHPIIAVQIGNIHLTGLVDSGSQISAISEATYSKCKRDSPWPELKIKKAKVKGAIIGKQIEIQLQSRMTMKCQGFSWEINLCVVPLFSH